MHCHLLITYISVQADDEIGRIEVDSRDAIPDTVCIVRRWTDYDDHKALARNILSSACNTLVLSFALKR